MLISASGSVTRKVIPASPPQTLQAGKPGLGGTGAATGAAVTSAGVTGAGVTGANVAGVTGADVPGPPGMIGEQPQAEMARGKNEHSVASMKPYIPARWMLSHVKLPNVGRFTTASGTVITFPSPQTSQEGKAGAGAGADMFPMGAQPQSDAMVVGRKAQKAPSIRPSKPVCWTSPHVELPYTGRLTEALGKVISIPDPHTSHSGPYGLGANVRPETIGEEVTGVATCSQPQSGASDRGREEQISGSTKPLRPALSNCTHETLPIVGIRTISFSRVTPIPIPQTLQGGKPT